MLETLKEYWPVAAGFVAVIVWALRVEAGMKQNASDIRALWKQRNEDLEASNASRQKTDRFLERLEEKIDRSFSEVRSDIKALLRQKGG